MGIIAKAAGPKISPVRYESDIYDIHFSSDGLSLSIFTLNESNHQADLMINFKSYDGFRYLDEGDLMRYWESDVFSPPCHVFEIESGVWRLEAGGWNNGERLESDILSASSVLPSR